MLQVGAASRVITNAIGRQVQGASVNQIAESIRDELEANALVVTDGTTTVVLISVDVAALEDDVMDAVRSQVASAVGVEPSDVIVTCTHTHAGPSVLPTSHFKTRDEAYLTSLATWCAEVAKSAKDRMTPARLRYQQGAAQLGFNRRCCWETGEHTMYRRGEPAMFTGIEGPVDPTHTAMLIEANDGSPIALVHANTAHPVNFYGCKFYSADYPGEARTIIRRVLGDLPVLYLNGPIGDIAQVDTYANGKGFTGEQTCVAMGALVAGTTLRLLNHAPLIAEPTFTHSYSDVVVERRLPDAKLVDEGNKLLARVDAGEQVSMWDIMWAHGRTLAAKRLPVGSKETMNVHALRLGELSIVTHPVELYCQFGIDLKRRSPAKMTVIADCSNGYSGYCPTFHGMLGGGYSGDALYWTRLAPDAGYRIVDEAARMLHAMWQ